MADFDRKRKFESYQNQPSKKIYKDHSYSRNHKTFQPLASHGLPPLPEISEKYQASVFTHPAHAPHDAYASYDRLEFLGDAYLELFASQLIFERFPHLEVGKMSQIRETLVKNETIGQYASLYGLDKQLKNYKQFQNGSPQVWLKIKGDIFEAYVAAVVLSNTDSGSTAKAWLHQLWEPKVQAASSSTSTPSKKSKDELAKKILMKGVQINYVDEKAPVVHYGKGKEEYFVGVYVTAWDWQNQYLGSGKGFSRVEAGLAAAADALNNHPLIDQVAEKKADFLAQRKKEAVKEDDMEKD